MTSVVVGSTSLAEDAAYLAMADAAAAADRIGVEYRIIGGQMVSVHVAASGADAPPHMTGDTDLGLEATLLADNRLLDGLREAGYALVAGNRFERDDGTRAIDVLVPQGDYERVARESSVSHSMTDAVVALNEWIIELEAARPPV